MFYLKKSKDLNAKMGTLDKQLKTSYEYTIFYDTFMTQTNNT